MYERTLSARLSGWVKDEFAVIPGEFTTCQRHVAQKKERKTCILHYVGAFMCSCFYPAGASLCGANISTPCLCKCLEGAEDTQVGSTGDHTAASHECQCECTCCMCVTHVTDSKHVRAWHPVHAGMHSNPSRSPLAHEKNGWQVGPVSDSMRVCCWWCIDGLKEQSVLNIINDF